MTSVRLPRDEHDALRRIATAEHRSMSGQIRAWIAAAIADHDEPGGAS